jgi:hypothetical protein
MTRSQVGGALCIVLLVPLGVYVARNTYWADVPIPTPPRGEAVTNPFYAAQRFAEVLGAATRRAHSPVLPSPRSVIVLSAWHWDLSPQRQAAIKRWVESGGRLVVDRLLSGDVSEFESWSGVEWDFNEAAAQAYYESDDDDSPFPECSPVEEVAPQSGRSYSVCGLYFSFVRTSRPMQWALRDAMGLQAVRVGVGEGSVTVINVVPFTRRSLFDGDHAALFVAATRLQRGNEVLFLTEDDHPSLLALLWIYGAPSVALSLVLLALFLWRGAARFGPMLALPEPRRRSMAEQIRGSGYFALRFGEGAPLHEAAVRALTEAAGRRIPAYSRLSHSQRAAALGKATGMDGDAIVSAIHVGKRRPKELPNTLALLECARRQLLNPGMRAGLNL